MAARLTAMKHLSWTVRNLKAQKLCSSIASTLTVSQGPFVDPKRSCSDKPSFNNPLDNPEFKKLIQEMRNAPSASLALGVAGVIPFVAPPLFMIYNWAFFPLYATAQLAYSASILSFIGGVRWGNTLPEGSRDEPSMETMGMSVAPSLVAWLALLTPLHVGLPLCALALAGFGYYDVTQAPYPAWFKGLRIALSSVAVVSIILTLVCKFLLSEVKFQFYFYNDLYFIIRKSLKQ